jgi:hypothetical protein
MKLAKKQPDVLETYMHANIMGSLKLMLQKIVFLKTMVAAF